MDWVDSYVDNGGKNRAVGFIVYKEDQTECRRRFNYLLKQVIRKCSANERELNYLNFKKLKTIVVNEYCFDTIGRWQANPKYEYVILIPYDFMMAEEAAIKHKLAHELAHFLFTLRNDKFTNTGEEEKACNAKAKEWGLPNVDQED